MVIDAEQHGPGAVMTGTVLAERLRGGADGCAEVHGRFSAVRPDFEQRPYPTLCGANADGEQRRAFIDGHKTFGRLSVSQKRGVDHGYFFLVVAALGEISFAFGCPAVYTDDDAPQ